MTEFVVFTDMDGTLLDHHTYSMDAAIPMLNRLKQLGIPVIPNTSKTYAEMRVLRETLGLDGPFCVENGAAIHIPHGFFEQKPPGTQWQDDHWVHQFCSRKHYWTNLLRQVKERYPDSFVGFSDMSLDDIVAATGLSPAQAALAAQRQYGEPVLWRGSEQQKQQFMDDLRQNGATPLQGGRFIHVSGDCNKGQALRWFMQEWRRQYPHKPCRSIALGDGNNDIAMLQAADVAIRILSPVNPPPTVQGHPHCLTSTLEGPAGWNEMLTQLLEQQV
ncbi:HAD-IIB family hydrolase [Aestuariibacter halophilus]|uniref:HAD-IIB family hydrolase n=1 Tax=Fluctibacter halophilus TaxID=226011 RepID=A0ABS8G4M3_9ALTE|nr:HAD-IIB family hydrolase [Aestuariibacter halophilus]MCC2615542.1 HAD-IIB family hydrolase [Aestuariibacter halophilus]